MFNSRVFWLIVATIFVYVVKFVNPTFPLDVTTVLNAILFILGLVGVVVTLRAVTKRALGWSDLLHSLPLWSLIASLVSFVVHYYFPTFPMDEVLILAVIVWVLDQFGIQPTIMKVKVALAHYIE